MNSAQRVALSDRVVLSLCVARCRRRGRRFREPQTAAVAAEAAKASFDRAKRPAG